MAQPTNNDAHLAATCKRFDDLERWLLAAGRGITDNERDALAESVASDQAPMLDDMERLRATTLVGILARATTLLVYDDTVSPERLLASDCTNERLLGLLLRDLASMAGWDRSDKCRAGHDAPAMPMPSFARAA